MDLRGGDRMDDAELDLRGPDLVRPRRPWALMVAALLLVVLVAVLWAKWSESRGDAERLRAELKTVYAEAESLRTQAAQAQQRVALLEKQVQSIRNERDESNATKPAPKAPAKPTPKSGKSTTR
jgi:uncharacterized protein YlxW (UPF0749 family)